MIAIYFRKSSENHSPGARSEKIRHPFNFVAFVKSLKSRHPGESRGPEVLGIPGFRLPPE